GDSDENIVSNVTAPAGVTFNDPRFDFGAFPSQVTPPPPSVNLNILDPPAANAPASTLQSAGANPFTYDALLIGAPDLIGTRVGEQIAGDNAVATLTAPGAAMLEEALLAKLLKRCPQAPYKRNRHYPNTPTKADRKALGAEAGETVDHNPPLVK